MEKGSAGDLSSIKEAFEKWRGERKGRARIPEQLWSAAIELLDYYPFNKVREALKLNSKQLQNRAQANGKITRHRTYKKSQPSTKVKKAFLSVTAKDLIKANQSIYTNNEEMINGPQCRMVLEREDGSKLTLMLPINWSAIESICNKFWC